MTTYNGQTTNFSGVGSPNPQKLVIPGKDKMDPPLRTAMLALEQWCNNLVAPPSSGGTSYASLTGPGQTTTPGKLTQLGDFIVQDNQTVGAVGIKLATGSTAKLPIVFVANDGVVAGSSANISLTVDSVDLAQVGLSTGGGSGAIINLSSTTTGPGSIYISSHTLGFFGATPVVKPTATGSRSANAALASLLTALAGLGLIVDSTTI